MRAPSIRLHRNQTYSVTQGLHGTNPCNKTKDVHYTIIERTDDIGLDAQYYVSTNSCQFFFLIGINDTLTQSFCEVIILLRFISTVLFTVWAEVISKSSVFLKLSY